MRYSERDRERFWSKVDRSGECWLWLAAEKGRDRGGAFYVGRLASGGSKYRLAHVASYEMAHDVEIPKNEWVLHTCGEKLCVRPEHLYHAQSATPHEGGRRYGCGCESCAAERTEKYRQGQRAWYRRTHPRKPKRVDEHGTYARYALRGCRCGPCVEAARAQRRKNKAERVEKLRLGLVDPPHGHTSTYTNYDCRCEPCRAAWSVHMAEMTERRRQRREAS